MFTYGFKKSRHSDFSYFIDRVQTGDWHKASQNSSELERTLNRRRYKVSWTRKLQAYRSYNGLTIKGMRTPSFWRSLTIGDIKPRGFRTIVSEFRLWGGRENSKLSTSATMIACISMRENRQLIQGQIVSKYEKYRISNIYPMQPRRPAAASPERRTS